MNKSKINPGDVVKATVNATGMFVCVHKGQRFTNSEEIAQEDTFEFHVPKSTYKMEQIDRFNPVLVDGFDVPRGTSKHNFFEAIKALKAGKTVTRTKWLNRERDHTNKDSKEYDYYLTRVQFISEKQKEEHGNKFIIIELRQGRSSELTQKWLFDTEEVFAEDWVILD